MGALLEGLLPEDVAMIKRHLSYSFSPIDWRHKDLTYNETHCIQDQAAMDRLKAWATPKEKS